MADSEYEMGLSETALKARNIKKTTLFQIYGITRKIDFLLIVEKIK